MMTTQNLLVELFVEELPPKALKKLGDAFANVLFESLKTQALVSENSIVTAFASPRRLAAHITNVASQAADKAASQKLMPAAVGLDANGAATPALIKKLSALGADESVVPQLKREHDGKADILFLDVVVTGATLAEGLQKALDEALAKLPIPKVMTYQLEDGWTSVNFVRPAHSLIALHGNEIVPIATLGLKAGNSTQGHRFEAAVSPVIIKDADSYEAQLKTEGAVIASFEERRKAIIVQLLTKAKQNSARIDCQPDLIGHDELTSILIMENDPLINEVTALVERPNVLLGQFEESFLEVPSECLSLTMKTNQKYFPLYQDNSGKRGKLTNKFLIVSNISPEDPSEVIGGNERVVRPRLADAKFFFDQDRKKTLESRIVGLDKVVYHNKLGSQGQRNARVVAIAQSIAEIINPTLTAKVIQAARLSKADLLTDMVGEFPELQGIMGRYYAQHEKLDDDVAFAIEDHYKPRFAGDELPRGSVGQIVALADKLETLVGLFSIGERPTGDKDPFALRRQALGILRIIIDAKLPIKFGDIIVNIGLAPFKLSTDDQVSTARSIREFCFDRLSINLKEQGASPQEVDAVLSLNPELLSAIPSRLNAVRAFASLSEAPALAAANKRVSNILKKVEGEIQTNVDAKLLKETAEIALYQALSTVKPQADAAFEAGDYTASLQALAALKAPVDAFFDGVMVNAEDEQLRANRLALLAQLHAAMNRVADLSKLAS